MIPAGQITEHFTWREATMSRLARKAGIDNSPPPELHAAIRRTAEGLEAIRTLAGVPIIVTSWYRSPATNALARGETTSQHVLGQAADIEALGMSASALAQLIDGHRDVVRFDQLILEYPPDGWVHVSFISPHSRPRQMALTRVPGEWLKGIQA